MNDGMMTPATPMQPMGVHTPGERGGDALMAMSAHSIRDRVQAIQEAMKAVMKKGTHYDVIPGTEKKDQQGNDISKPTLLKPGAEVLCMTFGLAPRIITRIVGDHPDIAYSWVDRKKQWFDGPNGRDFKWVEEKGQTLGYFEVVATCEIYSPTGQLLAVCEGSANNREKKYRTLNVYEVRNTLLKMAGKRAFIAAVLMATGASDMFTQDLEDDDDAAAAAAANKGGNKGGQQVQHAMNDAQKRMLWARAKFGGIHEDVAKKAFHKLDEGGDKKAVSKFLDSVGGNKTVEEVVAAFKPYADEVEKEKAAATASTPPPAAAAPAPAADPAAGSAPQS